MDVLFKWLLAPFFQVGNEHAHQTVELSHQASEDRRIRELIEDARRIIDDASQLVENRSQEIRDVELEGTCCGGRRKREDSLADRVFEIRRQLNEVCTICLEECMAYEMLGCLKCKQVLGCVVCVDTWYSTSNQDYRFTLCNQTSQMAFFKF